jgi:hypothetical protein
MRHVLLLSLLALPLGLMTGCECDDAGEEPQIIELPQPDPTPIPVYDRGSWLDMTLDADGRVWLAYKDHDDSSLNIARGDGDPAVFTHWQVAGQGEVQGGLLVGAYDGGNYATLAVDSAGTAHAAHYDSADNGEDGDGRLMYATGVDESWTSEEVEAFDVGRFASIGLVSGSPIIAYYDKTNGDLRVARRTAPETWEAERIDAGEILAQGDDDDSASADPDPEPEGAGHVGQYADLLVAEDGTVHVAYYDQGNGDLKLASGGFGNWDVTTAWSAGDVGHWPNLHEEAGTLYVSFQDVGNYDLLYGAIGNDGTIAAVEIADAGEFVGADSSLTFVDGEPAIMYQDAVNNDAMLARRDASGWTVTQHMTDGALGFHNNLAAGSDGRLNWAGFNHSTHDIEFQRF